MRHMSRREVLAGGVASMVLTRTARAAVSPVYLVRTTDRAEGIRRGLTALGVPAAGGKRVVVKPNFNSADAFPASTHPDTLALLVQHLRGGGASDIVVADRSGMGSTRRVMEQKGVFAQAQQVGYRAVVLDETPAEGWAEERLPGGHWGEVGQAEGALSRIALPRGLWLATLPATPCDALLLHRPAADRSCLLSASLRSPCCALCPFHAKARSGLLTQRSH